MLGCSKCMGAINTEKNHCCYCDAPPLGKALSEEIQKLEEENRNLKEQIELWKNNFCKLIKIRDSYVKERDELLGELKKLK